MVRRNYRQDITPHAPRARSREPKVEDPVEEAAEVEIENADVESQPEAEGARSIRDLRPSPARLRLQTPPRIADRPQHVDTRSRKRSWGIWVAVVIALVVLFGAGLLMLFPSTTITIVPRTQTLTFDASNPFTAYPQASAATGTISYTVVSQVFEDSTVVQASGVERAEEKATGSVTVYNEYSDKPVRLIKNTRFQSANGLIYRIPTSIDVPAMKGNTPGTITITVFADQTGPSYNIPAGQFTIPGLKSTPDMYAKVYAKSTQPFTGGFSGDRPAVSPTVLEAAKAEIRARLTEKARQFKPDSGITFPGLSVISFETSAPTSEAGGGVRILERATVAVPVFQNDVLATSIARAVTADAEGHSISLAFSEDIGAQPVGALEAARLGTEALTFTLSGRGRLLWGVDVNALAEALAGREEDAFKPIVEGFIAVEEARARIMPFWRHSFPADVSKIEIITENPQTAP